MLNLKNYFINLFHSITLHNSCPTALPTEFPLFTTESVREKPENINISAREYQPNFLNSNFSFFTTLIGVSRTFSKHVGIANGKKIF